MQCSLSLTIDALQSSIRREYRWLDHSTITRRHETCHTAASQLRSHHYYHNDRFRHYILLQCRVSLHTTSYSKSKSVGWDQFNHNPTFHEWPHVQPHQEGPLRRRRRKGWHFILCWWVLEPIRHGNTDRSRHV